MTSHQRHHRNSVKNGVSKRSPSKSKTKRASTPPKKKRVSQSAGLRTNPKKVTTPVRRSSKQTNSRRRRRTKLHIVTKETRKFLLFLCVVLFVCIGIGRAFFRIEVIQTFSMAPTLRAEDVVLVKRNSPIKRFDLVAIQQGSTLTVRRVIGLPQETIQYEDDRLYVDGKEIPERFIIEAINLSQRNGGQYTPDFQLSDLISTNYIPDGSYLVLGDNRPYATDSREWGVVPASQLKGVVWVRFLPLNDACFFS